MRKIKCYFCILSTCLIVGLSNIFSACGKAELQYVNFADGVKVVGVTNKLAMIKLEIPSTYQGKPVIAIGENAFSDCKSLTSVVIPDSVTSIERSAFSHCNNLTDIEMSNSVASIGDYAFVGCPLTDIKVPAPVNEIGDCAFKGCLKLANIEVEEDNQNYKDIDGNLYTKDGTTLLQYAIGKQATEFIIPDSVTTIGYLAISYSEKLTSLVISKSVTSIGEEALICYSLNNIEVAEGNPNYKGIDGNLYTKDGKTLVQYAIGKTEKKFTVPNFVTTIDKEAFSFCENLSDVVISDSVTSIDEKAFAYCYYLTSVKIGNSVTSIGKNAFMSCFELDSVVIPDSVNTIEQSAFVWCEKLRNVVIGDSVTFIGDGAFDGCENLTSIKIPDSVTFMGSSVFSSCFNLSSVEIGNSVTSIGQSAFSRCSKLTSIEIPDSVILIESSAFGGCQGLTRIEIPDSVTSIGSCAFYECANLTSVEIGDSVTSIETSAFNGCTSLTSVEIGDSVTSIGESSFSNCTSLTNITVAENNVTYKDIDGNLYSKDGTLLLQYAIGKTATAFTIPDSVMQIGDSAFADCNSLSSIGAGDSITSIGEKAFTNTDYYNNESNWEKGVLYIGKYLIEAKKTVTGVYKIKEDTLCIADYAFLSCANLTNVKIPDSVVSIGESAFSNCHSLTSVEIGDSVMRIGERAFSCCGSLKSATFTNTKGWRINDMDSTRISSTALTDPSIAVEYLRAYDFYTWTTQYYSEGLIYELSDDRTYYSVVDLGTCTDTDIVIPNMYKNLPVKKIGEAAFGGRYNLTNVEIGNLITSIGALAFDGCDSLINITVDENNQNYKDIDGNLYTKDGKTLIQYAIGKTAMSFTVPDFVRSIGKCAFSNCQSLTSVAIGNSVTDIGDMAFGTCSNLISVEMPDSVTSIGEWAFGGCSSLKSIVISDLVTSIGVSAFEACLGLASVTFKNPNGWSMNDISLLSTDLENSETAARYLRITYCSYTWIRED